MSKTSFLALAPELKQAIFSRLPDVSSLLSITLTCSSLRHTFLNAESLILTKVLNRQVHPLVTFDALAAYEASKLGPTDQKWIKEAVQKIMASYDGDRSTSWSRDWNLRDALGFETLNEHVEYFTREYVASELAVDPAGVIPGPRVELSEPQPPSSGEIGRIQRTLYRFELYCNLFRKRKLVRQRGTRGQLLPAEPVGEFNLEEQYNTFFARFPAWENEQLACIRDFLMERLTIPFNDVAAHDIGWGELGIEYFDYHEPNHDGDKERYLVRGLAYLHKVVTASRYEAKHDLLRITSPYEILSLSDGLDYRPQEDGAVFAEWDLETQEKILNHPHAADSDTGPKDTWLWAHEEAYLSSLYNNIYGGQSFLRQCGYVMWDRSRWEQCRLMDMSFEEWEDLYNGQQHPKDLNNSNNHFAQMQESFKARSRIWCKGGRGWWAPGDESRVVWPEGKAPKGWLSEDEWRKRDSAAEKEQREKQAGRDLRRVGSLEELLRAYQ